MVTAEDSRIVGFFPIPGRARRLATGILVKRESMSPGTNSDGQEVSDAGPPTVASRAAKFALVGRRTGSVPAAVASLAEGVLAMIAVARLKLIVIATVAFRGGGRLPDRGTRLPRPCSRWRRLTTKVRTSDPQSTGPKLQVRGVVVDEADRPVAKSRSLGRGVRGYRGARHHRRTVRSRSRSEASKSTARRCSPARPSAIVSDSSGMIST